MFMAAWHSRNFPQGTTLKNDSNMKTAVYGTRPHDWQQGQ